MESRAGRLGEIVDAFNAIVELTKNSSGATWVLSVDSVLR